MTIDVPVRSTPHAGSVTSAPLDYGTSTNRSRPMFSVPSAQLYYWTRQWQKNERIAMRELGEGRGVSFDSAADAIKWLLSDD